MFLHNPDSKSKQNCKNTSLLFQSSMQKQNRWNMHGKKVFYLYHIRMLLLQSPAIKKAFLALTDRWIGFHIVETYNYMLKSQHVSDMY